MSALLYVPFCLHYCFVNIVELFITFVPFCIFLVWSLSAAVQVEIKHSLFLVLLQWVHKMLIHVHKKNRRSAKICSFVVISISESVPIDLHACRGFPTSAMKCTYLKPLIIRVWQYSTISCWTELQCLCCWCHLKHFWRNIIWHKKYMTCCAADCTVLQFCA